MPADQNQIRQELAEINREFTTLQQLGRETAERLAALQNRCPHTNAKRYWKGPFVMISCPDCGWQENERVSVSAMQLALDQLVNFRQQLGPGYFEILLGPGPYRVANIDSATIDPSFDTITITNDRGQTLTVNCLWLEPA